MKYEILTFILVFCLAHASGQTDRTFLAHDHNYGPTYSYQVSEITIHSDSTFTRKDWRTIRKREWKSYKSFEPEVSSGRIKYSGKFYVLTEYRNGNKTDYSWKVKLSDNRLFFYYLNSKEKLRRGAKYKRIKK